MIRSTPVVPIVREPGPFRLVTPTITDPVSGYYLHRCLVCGMETYHFNQAYYEVEIDHGCTYVRWSQRVEADGLVISLYPPALFASLGVPHSVCSTAAVCAVPQWCACVMNELEFMTLHHVPYTADELDYLLPGASSLMAALQADPVMAQLLVAHPHTTETLLEHHACLDERVLQPTRYDDDDLNQ